MPHPISIATISAIGYLGGLFTMQAGRGLIMAFLAFATWVFYFHRGEDFAIEYRYRLLVDYFFPTLLAAFVGAMQCVVFRFHPVMDGLHLGDIYRDPKTGRVNYGKIGRLLAYLVVVMLIFFGAHLSLEIKSIHWPFVWAGVACSVFILAGWIAFYFLFRDQLMLFHPAPVEPGTRGRRSFWKAEITNYVILGFVGHEISVTAYWVTQLIWDNDVTFITSSWFFYTALIIWGAIGLAMFIVSFLVRPVYHDNYTAMTSPEDGSSLPPPPPTVAPSPETGASLRQLQIAGFLKVSQ